MRAPRSLSGPLFWAGVLLLIAAAFVLVGPFSVGGPGFDDLARVAGATLLTSVASLAFGGALLAARFGGRARLPEWRLVIAALGCVAGLAAGWQIVQVSTAAAVLLGVPLLLLAVGGLGVWTPLWRRARA